MKEYVYICFIPIFLSLSCMEKPCVEKLKEGKKGNNRIQKLYVQLFSFTKLYERKQYLNPPLLINDKLISLLNSIHNDQKNHNITEDIIGHFAYEKYDSTLSIDRSLLLLSFLKKYRLETKETNEQLPFIDHNELISEPIVSDYSEYNNLTWEQLSSHTCIKQKLKINLQTYPAYCALMWNIEKLFHENSEKIQALVRCLYTDEKEFSKNKLQKLYDNLRVDFPLKVTQLLQYKADDIEKHLDQLYDLLQIIEYAKRSHHIKEENELAIAEILIWDNNFGVFQPYPTFSTPIVCSLIEIYNNAKSKKITPIIQQYLGYTLQQNWNLALPHSFNNSLFDKNMYAFEEFADLIKDIQKIMDQACFKENK